MSSLSTFCWPQSAGLCTCLVFRFLSSGTAIPISRQVFSSWLQTFAVFWMLYAFFWVIPRRLNFIRRRFGTLCLFHLRRPAGTTRQRRWGWNRQGVQKRRHINLVFYQLMHSYIWNRQGVQKHRHINLVFYQLMHSYILLKYYHRQLL